MICENCGITHNGEYGSGRFCSSKCSRSFSTKNSRKTINEKVSKTLSGRKLTEEHKKKISRIKPRSLQLCSYCKSEMNMLPSDKRKFCSKLCWVNYSESNKSEFRSYKDKCKFEFDVYDFPENFDISLIEKHGWYTASNKGNNINGVSRDHMLSVREGFDLGISPNIIKHPANCELMCHSDNQKKRTKSSIKLEDLLIKIEKWNLHQKSPLKSTT